MRVAEKMKPAKPLEGYDPAFSQGRGDFGDRPVELRAAARAGDRFGVKAAVFRIGVIAGAIGAHREERHRGLRPVVREGPRQRVARPAMRAVDQGIAEKPALRIEQFVETRLAHRRISADAGRRLARRSRIDPETLAAEGRDVGDLDRVDAGERGGAASSAVRKAPANGPSTSISTPSPSLRTKPVRDRRAARP